MAAIIQSIRQLTLTILANQQTATGTLDPPVDPANTAIFLNGRSTNLTATTIQIAAACVVLTNATTVTAIRGVIAGNPLSIACTVVEFVPRVVNSIQYRSVEIAGALSAIDELPIPTSANGFVIYNGSITNVTTGIPSVEAGVALGGTLGALPTESMASIVTASLGTVGTARVYFCVVDLSAEVIASVQQAEHTTGGSAAVRTIPISPVDPARTILVCGGLSNGSGNWGNASFRAELTNPTTITLTKGAGAAVAPHLVITVVQFQADVLSPNHVQRGLTTLQSALSASSTLEHPVDLSRALCNWAGFSTAVATANSQQALVTSLMTDAQTQTTAINLANANANVTSWEVIEFAAGEGPEPEPETVPHQVLLMA